MGFFNKILKGLGFEDEETEEVNPEPKTKRKKDKKQNKNIIASFDLNNLEEEKLPEETAQQPQQIIEESKPQTLDFEVVKVKSQSDVQNAVQKLKEGIKILINIEQLSSADITRSLDFLTGAVFALNLKMQKLDDKIYLIQ